MFQVNDVVVYGLQGVCEIVGIDGQKVNGVIKNYFVLKPKNDKGATFYIPTWNEKAWSKMRKVMTKKDVDALIDSMPKGNRAAFSIRWVGISLCPPNSDIGFACDIFSSKML